MWLLKIIHLKLSTKEKTFIKYLTIILLSKLKNFSINYLMCMLFKINSHSLTLIIIIIRINAE